MSETAEQIQTEALPGCPEAEIPAELLEPQTPEPGTPSQDEADLTVQISELWRLHTDYAASMRSQSQNLRSLRTELGKRLAEMKQLLARPGRNGQWSAWLKERKIPRATADRLVAKYERSLNPDGNRLSEAISELTEEEIKSLLDKIMPRLRRVLRTPACAYRLLDLLSSSLALDREETDRGFIVIRPTTHQAVEQAAPVEAQVEPVPVIIEGLAQSTVESVSTSTAL